jgi:hypothetical protein
VVGAGPSTSAAAVRTIASTASSIPLAKFARRDPHDRHAARLKPPVPATVVLGLVADIVAHAVGLDR